MAGLTPPWLDHANPVDDRARYAAMTPEQRLEVFVEVARLADAILAERPDRIAVLARSDPMSARDEATWLALVRKGRSEQTTD